MVSETIPYILYGVGVPPERWVSWGAKAVMGEGKEINLGEDVVCNEIFITFVAKWWQEASNGKRYQLGY
jgi:hypothetical protein